MEKQGYVYILELEAHNWYVGFTQDLLVRIASHFLGAGSKWTQLHKPISVHMARPGDTRRGGSYTTVEMLKCPAAITKAMHYASYKTDIEARHG